jgi:hypothetical protein
MTIEKKNVVSGDNAWIKCGIRMSNDEVGELTELRTASTAGRRKGRRRQEERFQKHYGEKAN